MKRRWKKMVSMKINAKIIICVWGIHTHTFIYCFDVKMKNSDNDRIQHKTKYQHGNEKHFHSASMNRWKKYIYMWWKCMINETMEWFRNEKKNYCQRVRDGLSQNIMLNIIFMCCILFEGECEWFFFCSCCLMLYSSCNSRGDMAKVW